MALGTRPTVEVAKDDLIDIAEEHDGMYPKDGSVIDSAMTPWPVGSNYIDGRRYHAFREGRYPLPDDEAEQYRGNLNAYLFRDVMDGALYLSPLPEEGPRRVLELGTGTGAWAIDLAERFPDAQIVGVDLSRIQPGLLPNVDFQVDDVESEWLHPTDFDFIFMRELSAYIQDPAKLFERAFRHLKPGGWIELQELELAAYSDDGTLGPGTPLARMFEVVREVKWIGRNWGAEMHTGVIGGFLEAAGFRRAEMRMRRKVPWGAWPRNSNRKRYWGNCTAAAVELFAPTAPKLLAAGGLSPREIADIVEGARRTVNDHSLHSYSNFVVWTAQKPL